MGEHEMMKASEAERQSDSARKSLERKRQDDYRREQEKEAQHAAATFKREMPGTRKKAEEAILTAIADGESKTSISTYTSGGWEKVKDTLVDELRGEGYTVNSSYRDGDDGGWDYPGTPARYDISIAWKEGR